LFEDDIPSVNTESKDKFFEIFTPVFERNAKCHFQQYFSYIVVISFIGEGNQSTVLDTAGCLVANGDQNHIWATRYCQKTGSNWLKFKYLGEYKYYSRAYSSMRV
jgi:hypothetical protein